MSLTEIEEAVKNLSREELAKLAAFIARKDKLVWDEELEGWMPSRKLFKVIEELKNEGRL